MSPGEGETLLPAAPRACPPSQHLGTHMHEVLFAGSLLIPLHFQTIVLGSTYYVHYPDSRKGTAEPGRLVTCPRSCNLEGMSLGFCPGSVLVSIPLFRASWPGSAPTSQFCISRQSCGCITKSQHRRLAVRDLDLERWGV